MVKLKRLKILKYRNVRPGTELHFDDGVNLVLGQNASGKTTLLALISAVCRGDFSEFSDEDLQIEADLTADHGALALSLIHERPAGSASRAKGWSGEFVVTQTPAAAGTPPSSPSGRPIEVCWTSATTSRPASSRASASITTRTSPAPATR